MPADVPLTKHRVNSLYCAGMSETTDTSPVRGSSRAFGLALGSAPSWVVYPLAIAALHVPLGHYSGLLVLFLIGIGMVCSAAAIIIGFVLAIAARTRPFSAGMAVCGGIGIAVGVVIWAYATG